MVKKNEKNKQNNINKGDLREGSGAASRYLQGNISNFDYNSLQ